MLHNFCKLKIQMFTLHRRTTLQFNIVIFQMQGAQNRVYLNSGTLMLNINESSYDDGIKNLSHKAE